MEDAQRTCLLCAISVSSVPLWLTAFCYTPKNVRDKLRVDKECAARLVLGQSPPGVRRARE
jgi:hypothetical protein